MKSSLFITLSALLVLTTPATAQRVASLDALVAAEGKMTPAEESHLHCSDLFEVIFKPVPPTDPKPGWQAVTRPLILLHDTALPALISKPLRQELAAVGLPTLTQSRFPQQ